MKHRVFLYIQIISHYYVLVNGMGAKIHANLGNVLLIRRRMVLASNAHVIENENTLITRIQYT
jgi:hypothetical protein